MSVKTEIPGVNNAVQKLEELADRMRTDDFGFRNNDVDNIDKVIDALHQLEAERKLMHDLLETETIKSSILRHQLKHLPKNVREEVMEAVMAARSDNAKRLLQLQQQLEQMNANIVALDKRSRELEQENAMLHPERELLKRQHEEIVSQLNQRMAEKAQLQIALNETRDEVRQANQDIVDLEDGILQLKEDLIQERTEARQEKKRLRKAVTDTTQKTKEQKDQNLHKKKELDGVQEKLTESEGKLDEIRKSIRRYETSRTKLEGEERALTAQLEKQVAVNHQQRIRGAELMNERIKESRDFEEMQRDLLNRIRQYEEDIQSETRKYHQLEDQRKILQEELEEKRARQAEDNERVADADAQLQAAKAALNAKAEEVGTMQMENVAMQEEIEALGESHKAVLAQLNRQIEEYREQLSKERKERLELQTQKDTVSKDLDDLKAEAAQFMSEMTYIVQGGKRKHTDLSNEGIQLQKQLKDNDELISKLVAELAKTQSDYDDMFADLSHKTETMEAEIVALERAMEDKTQEIKDKTPIFLDLEKYFEERTNQYDQMKKEIVAMKNKKQSLEDEIKRTKRDKEMALAPQEQLRSDLKVKRAALMQQMKAHGAGTRDKEQEIFQAGCKLRAVIEENQKFEESCRKIEDDLADLQKEMDVMEQRKQELRVELARQKEELVKKWDTDAMMQEFFASRDEATAEAFGRLLERTEKRENKIDFITDRLKEELHMLAGFLDNISQRRPTGKRSKLDRIQLVRIQGDKQSRAGSRSRSRSKSRGREGSKCQEPDRSPEQTRTKSAQHTPTPCSREQSTVTSRQLQKC